MTLVRNIVRGFRAEIGARILFFAASGGVYFVLARSFTPGEYGLVFLALSILSVANLFASFSIPQSAARFVAESETRLDPVRAGYIVTVALVAVLVLTTAVAAVVFSLSDALAGLFGQQDLGDVLLVGAGLVVTSTLYAYFRRMLQGFKQIGASATVYAVEGIGRLVFVTAFVLVGFGTVGAIGGYTLGYLTATVVGAVLFHRYVLPDVTLSFDGDPALRKRVLQYAVPLVTTRAAKVTDNRLDAVLVGFLLGPAGVGFYELGKQVVHLCQAPAASLGFTTGPWLADEKASGKVEAVTDVYESALMYTLLLYVPVSAGIALLSDEAIRFVLGASYLPAADILQVLAALVVLQAVEEVSENTIDYLGRARSRAISKGSTATLNVLGIALLAPTFGLVGVAVAKVVTHAGYVALLLGIMYSEVAFDPRALGWSLALIFVVTGVMSALVLYATRFISGLVTLSTVVALGALAWATLAVAFGLLDREAVRALVE